MRDFFEFLAGLVLISIAGFMIESMAKELGMDSCKSCSYYITAIKVITTAAGVVWGWNIAVLQNKRAK